MKKRSIFIRLSQFEDKDEQLLQRIEALNEGIKTTGVFEIPPDSIRAIPGAPFAYWISERIRRVFADFPKMSKHGLMALSGASTKNDFKFLRLWWECPSHLSARTRSETISVKRWVPFAKGGSFSRFYYDLDLVIDWLNDGKALKEEISEYRGSRGWGYHWTASLIGHDSYFRPGLTWPRRTNGLCLRILPAGCIIGDKGPAILADHDDRDILIVALGLMNTATYAYLINALVARVSLAQSFEVGILQTVPLPVWSGQTKLEIATLAVRAFQRKQEIDSTIEISHVFSHPKLLPANATSLISDIDDWMQQYGDIEEQVENIELKLNQMALKEYGLTEEDIAIEQRAVFEEDDTENSEISDEEPESVADGNTKDQLTVELLSYLFGTITGRWDIRYATGEKSIPDMPDPFAPLPVCSPGMLQSADGLPLMQSPPGYPVEIQWDGMLVDDENHPADVVGRVRQVIELLWGDRAAAIEREACEILGVKTLRDYFRKSGKGGFWDDHVKRYSKSRRQAPIYWLLQSKGKNYGLWLYYHQLDKDLLYKALVNYVEPKIRLEAARLNELRGQLAAGNTGAAAKKLAGDVEKQDALLTELDDFRDKLKRAADLNLDPDLNDGVVLNIAPLWELVPWKVAKSYWDELIDGKYEWSTVSGQLRARGLI